MVTGMVVIFLDKEWDEYQVKPFFSEKRQACTPYLPTPYGYNRDEETYHTNDLEDALSTARIMAKDLDEKEEIPTHVHKPIITIKEWP